MAHKTKPTTLEAFFNLNLTIEKKILYVQVPEFFRWNEQTHTWILRKREKGQIGRLHPVSPNNKELFALRLLLNHILSPKSYKDLRTVNGIIFPTYHSAAVELGIIKEIYIIRESIEEASKLHMPQLFRSFLVSMSILSLIDDLGKLMYEFRGALSEKNSPEESTWYSFIDEFKHRGMEPDTYLIPSMKEFRKRNIKENQYSEV